MKLTLLKTRVENDVVFQLYDNGTVYVKGYQGNGSEIIIPETVEGNPITEIGSWAFRYTKGIKRIHLPASVENIGYEAFPAADRVVDEEYMRKCREEFNRLSHNAVGPRYSIYNREEYESAEMATHMVFYKDVYDFTAIVDAGSYAEEYCRNNQIPYEIRKG